MSTTYTVTDLLSDVAQYSVNPAKMVRKQFEVIEGMNDGSIKFLSATGPFQHAIEMTGLNTSLFLQEASNLTRRQYPSLAQTREELYPHMSDTDFINAFATPSSATFRMIAQESQIRDAMVRDPITGLKTITIPRNTVITVANIPFSLQYPIHIQEYDHGGLLARIDTSKESPLKKPNTNYLPIELVKLDGVSYALFNFEADQFNIISTKATVDTTSGFTTKVAYSDQFYSCRVYQYKDGAWSELAVSYSQEVYDPATPTAVITVLDSSVSVNIPLVYVNANQIRGKLRIDVYQTKGQLAQYLSNYSSVDFTASWRYLDEADGTPQVAAMQKITNMMIWSTDVTSGGRAQLSFEELRARVVDYSVGPRKIPITNVQIETALADKGYSLVKSIDTITLRNYWASKPLPAPSSLGLANSRTPASASVVTAVAPISTISNGYGVMSHSTGVTLTPSALFKTVNGISTTLSTSEYLQLDSMQLEDKVRELNTGAYHYSPFYYVLDTTGNQFNSRAYYLDAPEILSRNFISTNSSSALQVNIGQQYVVEKTYTGFRLTVKTSSNQNYQALSDTQISCVLRLPGVENSFVACTSVATDSATMERVFVFDLMSNYDIDENDSIVLSNFTNTQGKQGARTSLTSKLELIFTSSSSLPAGFTQTSLDNDIIDAPLPSGSFAISKEILTIEFGKALPYLWTTQRSVASQIEYLKYDTDIPMRYEQDVYDKDPITGSIVKVVNGVATYNILHHKGDLKKNALGETLYKYRAGDTVIDDITGEPVIPTGYSTSLKREFSVFSLDAIYKFANDSMTTQYVADVKAQLIKWITTELNDINDVTLEKTSVFFHPKVSRGQIDVRLGDGIGATVNAQQSLTFTLYVTPSTYSNSDLLAKLQSSTIIQSDNYLRDSTTISDSGLVEHLMKTYGSDVVSVSVEGLLGTNDPVVATVLDSATQFSLAKSLRLQANGQLIVTEAVKIGFVVHDNTVYG